MGWMSDYIAGKDAEYDRMTDDGGSWSSQYYAAKDAEEEVDDRSLMQVYLDSKDAEEEDVD